MKVNLEPTGPIKEYFPHENLEFILGDQATLVDLYREIGETIGKKLPDAIWNQEERRFRGPVLLSSNGQVIRDDGTQLHDDQNITLRRLLVGG